MNNTEIKKALECHTKEDGVCDGCPLYPNHACFHILSKGALDLINRNQAEIEQWKREANRYQNLYCVSEEDAVKAKSEDVKEFAGLLKARLRDVARGEIGGCTYYMIGESFVDKIVKEMAGDTE